MSDADVELLEAAIEKADERDDEVASNAFRAMLDRRRHGYITMGNLTPKQRAWAEAVVAGKRYEPDPEYQNLVSEGKVAKQQLCTERFELRLTRAELAALRSLAKADHRSVANYLRRLVELARRERVGWNGP